MARHTEPHRSPDRALRRRRLRHLRDLRRRGADPGGAPERAEPYPRQLGHIAGAPFPGMAKPGKEAATVAEVLKDCRQHTAAFGKWQDTPVIETSIGPKDRWPATASGISSAFSTARHAVRVAPPGKALRADRCPGDALRAGRAAAGPAVADCRGQERAVEAIAHRSAPAAAFEGIGHRPAPFPPPSPRALNHAARNGRSRDCGMMPRLDRSAGPADTLPTEGP